MENPKWGYKICKTKRFKLIPVYCKKKLMWKDKYDTPRVESVPNFVFEFLWFELYGYCGTDDYWSQWLWIHKYNNGDIEKAKKTWPWIDGNTKKSSWKEF